MRSLPWILLLPLVTSLIAGNTRANPQFSAPAFSAFDGTSYGSLQIGKTTRRDAEKFDHRDGANSLTTVLPITAGDLALQFKDSSRNAKLVWMSLAISLPVPLGKLETEMGSVGTPYYPKRHYDDWSARAFPDGLIALVAPLDGKDVAERLLFAAPSGVQFFCSCFSPTPTPPVDIAKDGGPHFDRQLVYDGLQVGTMQLYHLTLKGSGDKDGTAALRDIVQYAFKGLAVCKGNGNGAVLSISGNYYPNMGTFFSIDFTMDGKTSSGPIHVEEKRDVPFHGVVDGAISSINFWLACHLALDGVLGDARNDLREKIRAQDPESPVAFREKAWDAISTFCRYGQ